MDLQFTPEEEQLRREVRAWLDSNLPLEWRRQRGGASDDEASQRVMRDWQRRLYDAGWMKLDWPEAAGGRGATPMMVAVYQEELARASAPPVVGTLGVQLLVPVLMAHGSDWQKDEYVDRILSGELMFCQGFSEPDAGSDLASLRTSAVKHDHGWVINGQKVWSSGGHRADWCFLLARTDLTAPPHRGIGYFLVDMSDPGIEVRRIRQMTGESDFVEIFLNDVVVDDRNVVGAPTDGWGLAMRTFGFERGGLANAARFENAALELRDLAKRRGRSDDARVRQQVAQAVIEAKTFWALSLRALSRAQDGATPGSEASMIKLYWSEMDQRMREFGVELQGLDGAVQDGADRDAVWRSAWLWAQAETIYAGTSEIQRNIIAERVLGMPRSR